MKKNDWIMIAAVVAIAAVVIAFQFFGKEKGVGTVEIQVNGEIYGTYSLNEEQKVEINDTNELEIKDGTAEMTWADCPDQVCVHHKEISRDGESIICLPNEVVISIVGGEVSELDAVAD